METMIYEYEGALYPEFLKHGNAAQFIIPTAQHFCKGEGFDIGCGDWPFPGAIPIDAKSGGDAMNLPDRLVDYAFSSHALEHLPDPVGALQHWISRLKPGGTLFVYLPHESMRYWQISKNRKHLHEFRPEQIARIFRDLGLVNVIHGERDMAWGFACVGFKPHG